MKQLFLLGLVALLLAGCAPSAQSQITDNGKPAQIKVIVFQDINHNGVRDQGEAGVQDQVDISQDLSCPSTHEVKDIKKTTNPNGVALFQNLKPGQYCVGYGGIQAITTKLTAEVDVSSEQVAQVAFGATE